MRSLRERETIVGTYLIEEFSKLHTPAALPVINMMSLYQIWN